MQTANPASRSRLVAIFSIAVLTLGAACGDATGSANRLTLEAPDANVATYEVATAVVRGATLSAESYEGVLGTAPVIAARVNDSTIAVLIPPVPAGPHLLKLSIGSATAEVTLQVSVTPVAGDPAAYIAVVDSAIVAEIAALDTALALVASGPFTPDPAAFARDRAMAQAALDSGRIAFAALTPAERQEAASILRATYGVEIGGAAALFARGGAPAFCNDRDLPLSEAEAQECADASAAELRTHEENAVYCQAASINAAMKGRSAQFRSFFRQMVNGCHYSRVAHWSATTWAAIQWPTMPKIDLFGQFDPDASTGSLHAQVTASQMVGAAPLVFHGIDFYSFPVRVQFRPMVTGDVGKVTAATQLHELLSGAAEGWQWLNSILPWKLGQAPAALAQATAAPWQTLTHTPARVRLGAVQPQAIRWVWQQTATGLNLKFDADDRSQPISFTFDVIYDAGAYGADTIRVPAVLAVDSTRIYEAAVLGRWTGTFPGGYMATSGEAVRPVDFRSNVFNWGPRVDIMTAAIIDGLRPDGTCYAGVYKVGTTCEDYFSWKIYYSNGRYQMEVGHLFDGTITTTPLALPLTAVTVFANGIAKMRLTK